MLKFEAKKGDFAKIWQKLGGGATDPQPPGSAAHVSLRFLFLNVLSCVKTLVKTFLCLKFNRPPFVIVYCYTDV